MREEAAASYREGQNEDQDKNAVSKSKNHAGAHSSQRAHVQLEGWGSSYLVVGEHASKVTTASTMPR
jgi:hypothetical protein